MTVYMIQSAASAESPVKIGHSIDPETRRSELQVAHWERLRIIRLFEGGEPEETALHTRFIDQWITGEWHLFTRAMLGDVGLKEIPVKVKAPMASTPHPFVAPLLAEIEDFLTHRRMPATTFGKLAVSDGKLVSRLRTGANVTTGTLERIRSFLAGAAA